MSRRGGSFERLGALIQRENNLRPPSESEVAPVAFRDWEAAVGTRIAARARPVRLERGVLYVRAASSTWAQELSLLGDTIAEQLRSRGVPVSSLRFRVGKVEAVERPPWRDEVRPEPPEAPLPPEVRQELGRVADPGLRDAIGRAAAKNLGWQAAEAMARAREAAKAPGGPPPRPSPPVEVEATAARAAAAVAPPATSATRSAAGARPAVVARPVVTPGRVDGPAVKGAASHAKRPASGPSEPPATSARRGAPDPRSAASRSARSGRTKEPAGEGRRGKP